MMFDEIKLSYKEYKCYLTESMACEEIEKILDNPDINDTIKIKKIKEIMQMSDRLKRNYEKRDHDV